MSSDEKPLPTIGVDRLVIAPLSTDTESGATYLTSIAAPGLVQVTDTPGADIASFYADDYAYVLTSRPGEPNAALTVANLNPELEAYLLGQNYDDSNGLVVGSNEDNPIPVAVGYRAQLSSGVYEYVWYMKGYFTRQAKTYDTKGNQITFQSKALQFNMAPLMSGVTLFRKITSDDPNFPVGLTDSAMKSILTGWFSDPNYVPASPGTPIADFAAATGAGASGSIDCTFSAPTGATRVIVQVYDPVTGNWNEATTSATLTETSTSATVTGLTASNSYDLRLVVTSGASNGISNTDTATAKA